MELTYIIKKNNETITTVRIKGKKFSKATDLMAMNETPVDRIDAIFTAVRMDSKFYKACN